MKSFVQIFIMITLLIFSSLPSYGDIAECCIGISTGYTVHRIMKSINKTEGVNCNEKPELCITYLSDKNSTK